MSPHVSVVIPAYNAAPFLAEALESVLVQTVTDREIIVVDDGSTDDTRVITRAYGPAITVLAQDNRGLPAARNAGARHASGTWLAFLDADDVWFPDKLEKQLELTTLGAKWVYSDRLNFGATEGVVVTQSQANPVYDGDIFLRLFVHGNFITASSVLIDRAVFDTFGGFSEDFRACEDWDLWLRVAERHEVAVCREPLLKYRYHDSNMSRDPSVMWTHRIKVLERALSLHRAQAISVIDWRRAWSRLWRDNASDARRFGRPWLALLALGRAGSYWPCDARLLLEIARTMLGR
jgi:glycosyltransferase involved in cell wall biosynthesis